MSETPSPVSENEARVRRNRLVGRIAIIALGLLVLVQVAPLLIDWAQKHGF
jgi:hypothetical protein